VDFKVRITDEALADFEEILEYSWIGFAETTECFGNAVLDHISLLERFPKLGAAVPGRPEVRKPLHTPILIYYRIDEARRSVEVLRFWHGSRRSP
jgi:plasmid stabilization system protein ParE